MAYKIINAISSAKVPKWGNTGATQVITLLSTI